MDITGLMFLLFRVVETSTEEEIITNKIYLEFIHHMNHFSYMTIHASCIYDTCEEDEYYTFEGLNDLLDSLVRLSCGERHEYLCHFVAKIEYCVYLSEMIQEFQTI